MHSPSFLHIADGSIDLSLNPLKKESLKSHIKYSLLFEENILFTDTQLIDNRNLRELLFEDCEFASLFNKDNLIIALRNVIDIRKNAQEYSPRYIHSPTIADVLEGFISWDKCYWRNNLNTNDRNKYAQTGELNNIAKRANLERYSLVSVGCTFTDDVLALLAREEIQKNIGEKLATQIYELVIQKRIEQISEINPKGGIGIAYFKNQLDEDLRIMGFEKEWKKSKKVILDIVQSPYLTALPKIFNANPIYGEMHKPQIQIMNGKSKMEIIGEDEAYNTRLMQYEIGINSLTTKSIFKLRESSQFENFRNSIDNYDGSIMAFENVKYFYETYKNTIDDEILKCFPFLKEPKKICRENVRPVELLYNTPNYAGIVLSSLAILSVNFSGMNPFAFGLGILGLVGAKFSSEVKEKDRSDKEIYKRTTIKHLETSKSNKISGQYIANEHSNSTEQNVQKCTHSILFSSVN